MHDTTETHAPGWVGPDPAAWSWRGDSSFSFSRFLAPGLYMAVLHVDLAGFDWERLFFPLDRFGNAGQRTGPWDFDLRRGNAPLTAAWRVAIDGRPVGLVVLPRPTTEDVARRRQVVHFGFRVEQPHEVVVSATPVGSFTLAPLCLVLEPAAFDALEAPTWASRGLAANWAYAQGTRFAETGAVVRGTEWERFMLRGVEFHEAAPGGLAAAAVPLFCAAARLLDRADCRDQVLAAVDRWLALPAWGNPDPDGYGHNADFVCAELLRAGSIAVNWFGDELGPARCAALLARLERQGDLFWDAQLLQHDYWGGAVCQDHGYRSTALFALSALSLVGHSPRAAAWLSFLVPRLRRIVRAMPEDGFIPFATYHKPQLHLAPMAEVGAALHYASGENLLAAPALRNAPRFILSCLDEASMSLLICCTRGERKDLNVGLLFFVRMAREFRCRFSAYLADRLMAAYRQADFRKLPPKAYESLPWAILEAGGTELPRGSTRRPRLARLQHFADGGAIQYRDPRTRWTVSVMCHPPGNAHHALGTDLSATDVFLANPSCGMFTVAVGDEPLLQCAESGYRTGTALGNVLLIDGRGQCGDFGIPMGVPMRGWRGERIQVCRAGPGRGEGFARLNLAPAYPDELDVLTYTRDFFFGSRALRVRDTVVCRTPHRFGYRFHTYRRHTVTASAPACYRIAAGDGRAIEFDLLGTNLVTDVRPTDVVWAYANEQGDEPFQHIAVETVAPAASWVLDFVVRLLPEAAAGRPHAM